MSIPDAILEPPNPKHQIHVSDSTTDTGCLLIHKYCYYSTKYPQLVDHIRDLLEYASTPTNHGWTPLMIASSIGNARLVTLLLDQGVDPNQSSIYGVSPLYLASQNGHIDIVSILLHRSREKRPSPPSREYTELEPLLVHVDHIEVDPVRDNGTTPLHVAAHKSRWDIISLLLDAGADPLRKTKNGRTPYDVATEPAEFQRVVAEHTRLSSSRFIQ